jgi:hypothetical protein
MDQTLDKKNHLFFQISFDALYRHWIAYQWSRIWRWYSCQVTGLTRYRSSLLKLDGSHFSSEKPLRAEMFFREDTPNSSHSVLGDIRLHPPIGTNYILAPTTAAD